MPATRAVRTPGVLVGVLVASPLWAADLDATDAETPKVAAINKYAQQMEPVVRGSDGPLMRMRSVKHIEAQREADPKAVLPPDQFRKCLASREEMRDKSMDRILEGRAHARK